MMLKLDEELYDENKIEAIEFNCPWTITVPSGASHDFMTTKLKWSFEQPFWFTANINPTDNPPNRSSLILKEKHVSLQSFSSL